MGGPAAGARLAAVVAAVVQAATVVTIVGIGAVSDGLHLDPWRPVAVATLYLVPAALAALALRARPSLLLAAAVTSLVLAMVGFSLHSFVFLPVAVVYAVAHSRLEEEGSGKARLAPVLLCPPLALGALALLFLHEDSACYTRHASGEVTVDRDVGDVTSGHEVVPAGSDVVESGCTSDTVVGWEAAGSVALSALALVAAVGLTPPLSARDRDTTPSPASV